MAVVPVVLAEESSEAVEAAAAVQNTALEVVELVWTEDDLPRTCERCALEYSAPEGCMSR